MAVLLEKQDNKYIWTGGYATRETPKSAGFRWDSLNRYWWTDSSAAASKLAEYADQSLKDELSSAKSSPKHLLQKQGDRYVWLGGYDTRETPKSAGFRWDGANQQWWTSIEDNATKLSEYAAPDLRRMLERRRAEKQDSIEASKQAASSVDAPHPEGLEYLPYQKAGIQYALRRPNTLFGDEMGLGKTIQAIGVINSDSSIKRVLVVSPASLKINWKREFEKWLVRPLSVGIADAKSVPITDVVIVNYDILTKLAGKLKRDWDVVIADEVHLAKNGKAQRTVALLGKDKRNLSTGKYEHEKGIADYGVRRIFLTGTPILNRPIELWTIAHSLAPKEFPSFMGFAKRYANAQETRYGWDFSGASNLGELQDKLRASIMVRRLKKDVLTELPAKRRQVVELEPSPAVRHLVEKENLLLDEQQERLEQHRIAVELAKAAEDDDAYARAVAGLREAAQVAFAEISKERHELAVAKAPQVIDFIKEALEQEDKLVVFAHHKDVIDAIMAAFPEEAVKLTGDDNMIDRQKAVDDFQNNPKIKLFVGSIKAAGVGITLTAASHVIFAELDWVPGNITQAEDRLHRIGQKDMVNVQHLVFDGSLDSKMAKTLVDKQRVADAALDKNVTPDEIVPVEDTPIIPVDESSLAKVTRKHLTDAKLLTPTQVAAIHAGLKAVAGFDFDSARLLNNMGFNRIDTGIGKALAELPALNPRQAQMGLMLVRRYRRQIPQEIVDVAVGTDPTQPDIVDDVDILGADTPSTSKSTARKRRSNHKRSKSRGSDPMTTMGSVGR